MGKPTGFLEFTRALPGNESPEDRKKHYHEFGDKPSGELINQQAARCMDCGVPFCHSGCPLGNIIPEFNDATYSEHWEDALEILVSTNNFPEFTGRICPAPCESACVLGINQPPVAIEFIEKTIVEKGFELGLIIANPPKESTGKTVAVIGAGPSGLACAQQLNKAGHSVTVFERAEEVGGLLRYGVPDFKLEKWVVQRRADVMKEEGVGFKTATTVGKDVAVNDLLNDFDAITAIVRNYFDGLHHGDITKLKSIFHHDVYLKSAGNRRSVKQWLTDVANRETPIQQGRTFAFKLLAIDIVKDQAMVKIECPLFNFRYIDFLGLLRENGRWLIVSKMYTDINAQ